MEDSKILSLVSESTHNTIYFILFRIFKNCMRYSYRSNIKLSSDDTNRDGNRRLIEIRKMEKQMS